MFAIAFLYKYKALFKGPCIFWCCYFLSLHATPVLFESFSFSPEELVFASKLSDVNRHKFCYIFTQEERSLAFSNAKKVSPDESVETIFIKLNIEWQRSCEEEISKKMTQERSFDLPCYLVEKSIDEIRQEEDAK